MSDRRIVTVRVPAQTVRVLVDVEGWDEANDLDAEAIAYAREFVAAGHFGGLDRDPIRIDHVDVANGPSDSWALPELITAS